jgi:arylsulfatase A-like enzyme
MLWGILRLNAARLTDSAINILSDAKQNDKLFIWLHYFDSHLTYSSPSKYVSYYLRQNEHRFNENIANVNLFALSRDIQDELYSRKELVDCLAAYHASLTYIDENIGKLIKYLEKSGEYDDCMIIIAADHGENLVENGIFCSHDKLFDETTKVPLIIKFPQNKYKGKTCGRLVELVDIYPTILAQFNIDHPENIRGVDLARYLTGEKYDGKTYVLSEHVGDFQRSIRNNKWQLIEAMPPAKWRVDEKNRSKLALELNKEGDILLSRVKNDGINYASIYPEVVSDMKIKSEMILESKDINIVR